MQTNTHLYQGSSTLIILKQLVNKPTSISTSSRPTPTSINFRSWELLSSGCSLWADGMSCKILIAFRSLMRSLHFVFVRWLGFFVLHIHMHYVSPWVKNQSSLSDCHHAHARGKINISRFDPDTVPSYRVRVIDILVAYIHKIKLTRVAACVRMADTGHVG